MSRVTQMLVLISILLGAAAGVGAVLLIVAYVD